MEERHTTKTKPTKLFEPIKIGLVEIKNRVAMAPMNCLYSGPGGYISEQQLAYYAARARGGIGLVITECTMATALGAKFDFVNNLKLWNNTHIAGMTELAETIHYFGAKVFVQLSIGFGNTGHTTLAGEQPYAPSPIPYEIPLENLSKGFRKNAALIQHIIKGEVPREMTVEEIHSEEQAFAKSARMAVTCGFDGIEIHAPHGYLEHQFLSPKFNKRTDEYGGSLENRMRFLLEVCKKTKDAVGNSIALGVRASACEHRPGGITYEDQKVLVKRLEELGIDYFHLSDGSYEALKWFFPDKDDAMLEEAKGFREIVKIPIITPSVHDPQLAERAIHDGMTDMISLGRQCLADPEWTNKAQAGKFKEINKCIRCNECIVRICLAQGVRCATNPNTGREKYMPEYWRPTRPKGQKVIAPQVKKMIEEKGGSPFHA